MNSSDPFNLCNFEGFNTFNTSNFKYFNTLRNGVWGGGVSIFCENSYNIEKLESLSVCVKTIESCAGRFFINMEFHVIVGTYRPYLVSTDNYTVILESLLNNDILSNVSLVLLSDDMNANLTDVASPHIDNYV